MKKILLILLPLFVVSNFTSCANTGAKEYSITFDAGERGYFGGDPFLRKKTIKVKENELPKIDEVPVKPDLDENSTIRYSFSHWSPEIKFATEDKIYTAIYDENKYYTVTFHSTGGSKIDPVKVKANDKVAVPPNPTYKDEIFVGWYTDPIKKAEEYLYDFNRPVTKDIDLYASWIRKQDSLEKYSWSDISKISKAGQASKIFKIGDTKNASVNGQKHLVRIIDFDHDVTKNGKKIGITFEFANCISDKDGYSLASFWNEAKYSLDANKNYLDSTLRHNLNSNDETPNAEWYTKKGTTKSTSYKSSVWQMLDKDLRAAIVPACKEVYINSSNKWHLTTFTDPLFILSASEVHFDSSEFVCEKLPVYKYYENAKTTMQDNLRIKHQVNNLDPERSASIIKDSLYTFGECYNFAGYDDTTSEFGTYYWLRSPNINTQNGDIVTTEYAGNFTLSFACKFAYPIVPAFCI